MIDDPAKAIRRAVLVAKGLSRTIGPMPGKDEGERVHPASMVPGVHVQALAGGGEVEPTDETGFDAFHGTPHGFDQFDLAHVGRGEGAQAYGHGMYFAGDEGIAQGYRKRLSGDSSQVVFPAGDDDEWGQPIRFHPDALENQAEQAAARALLSTSNYNKGRDRLLYLKQHAERGDAAKAMKMIRRGDIKEATPGYLYHVRVNANPEHFLDWDKPLSEQRHVLDRIDHHIGDPEIVMQRLFADPSKATGKDLHDAFGGKHKPEAVATKLQGMGIPGIRYLDATSRGPTNTPTHNHVIFDPSVIDIKRRYKRGGGVEGFADGGMPGNNAPADHPAWIPQRLVTSKKAGPAEATDRPLVNLAALQETPKLYEKNVNLLRDYPNMPAHVAAHGSTDQVADHFINHVVDNLLSLHDQVPEETRNRSRLWYDGANKIAQDWAKRYNIPLHSAAGALAALSPQKDWFQNVSLAHRVVHAMKGGDNFYKGFAADDNMKSKFQSLGAFDKPEYHGIYDLIHGKTLHDIDRMDMSPEEKSMAQAMFIRLHDETYNPRSYNIVTPEGGYGALARNADGGASKVGWGSLPEIAKAIESIKSANDPTRISELMGEKHKVRNFYNNILSPDSMHGDVTIDTHAVAAGLYRPMSGKSVEVAHNFGSYAGKGIPNAGGSAISGVQGTYPLYAEAYRRAAKERGILPREMQSITWEAVRGLFPDVFKTPKAMNAIDAIWNEHRHGNITPEEARSQVNAYAAPEGIRPPEWEGGRSFSVDEADGGSHHAGALPQSVAYGAPAASVVSGAGGGTAPAVSPGTAHSNAIPKVTPGYARGGDVIDRALSVVRHYTPHRR